MPHIHTEPGQRDMTVSAYIIRRENNQWKCLVHFHKKMQKLLQIGGHIELNETPWQAISHELAEESGYTLDDVQVLQYTGAQVEGGSNVVHPVPFAMNTHNVGNEHYHSDLCYGFWQIHCQRSTFLKTNLTTYAGLLRLNFRKVSLPEKCSKMWLCCMTFCLNMWACLRLSRQHYFRLKNQALRLLPTKQGFPE